MHPSAFILANGDFNYVNVSRMLTDFKKYVTCSTRQNKTLDMLFANVKDAYRSTARPSLGGSDHNLVRLVPRKEKGFQNRRHRGSQGSAKGT